VCIVLMSLFLVARASLCPAFITSGLSKADAKCVLCFVLKNKVDKFRMTIIF